MTDSQDIEIQNDAPNEDAENVTGSKVRVPLTPEQRERKNARDRERRAARSSAKTQAAEPKDAPRNYLGEPGAVYEGTRGQQQTQRDKPYQHALSASLQAQDKARAARRTSQQRQP